MKKPFVFGASDIAVLHEDISNGEAGRILGLGQTTVWRARRRLGIPARSTRTAKKAPIRKGAKDIIWTRNIIKALGKLHDKEVACMYFLDEKAVKAKRESRHIPACKKMKNGREAYTVPLSIMALSDEDRRGLTELLGLVKDYLIGYKYDIDSCSITRYRKLLDIPTVTDDREDVELTQEILDACKSAASVEVKPEDITLKTPEMEVGARYSYYTDASSERKRHVVGRLKQITPKGLHVFELELPTPRIETFSPAQFIGKEFIKLDED